MQLQRQGDFKNKFNVAKYFDILSLMSKRLSCDVNLFF